MAILGYARVSTHGQVLDIQELQLRAEGCTKIYAETRLIDQVIIDCVHRPAVMIAPVSAISLRATGIFRNRPGDFRRFQP